MTNICLHDCLEVLSSYASTQMSSIIGCYLIFMVVAFLVCFWISWFLTGRKLNCYEWAALENMWIQIPLRVVRGLLTIGMFVNTIVLVGFVIFHLVH